MTSTECIGEEKELCILVVGLDNDVLFWTEYVHIYANMYIFASIFVKSVPCAATIELPYITEFSRTADTNQQYFVLLSYKDWMSLQNPHTLRMVL